MNDLGSGGVAVARLEVLQVGVRDRGRLALERRMVLEQGVHSTGLRGERDTLKDRDTLGAL